MKLNDITLKTTVLQYIMAFFIRKVVHNMGLV